MKSETEIKAKLRYWDGRVDMLLRYHKSRVDVFLEELKEDRVSIDKVDADIANARMTEAKVVEAAASARTLRWVLPETNEEVNMKSEAEIEAELWHWESRLHVLKAETKGLGSGVGVDIVTELVKAEASVRTLRWVLGEINEEG